MICYTFVNEEVDDYLSFEELNDINGSSFWEWIMGKEYDAADWIAGKLGNGDSKYEWKDD